MGACLEDEALGLQSGHAWIPMKAAPSCSQIQHLCTHRAHQRLQTLWQADKGSYCAKEKSQAKHEI